MEFASGGELFTLVANGGAMDEARARVYFKQIASAAAYCHSQGVCHRDLKLENVLLAAPGASAVKITGAPIPPNHPARQALNSGLGLKLRACFFRRRFWAVEGFGAALSAQDQARRDDILHGTGGGDGLGRDAIQWCPPHPYQLIRPIGAEGLDRRGPAGSCRLFLGPGVRLGARWNRLVETVKTRKKREKTGGRWARYGLRSVNQGS